MNMLRQRPSQAGRVSHSEVLATHANSRAHLSVECNSLDADVLVAEMNGARVPRSVT